ncbi:MAG: hypothetical protein WA803_04770, partial [Steroidobacteraceae bacterium]
MAAVLYLTIADAAVESFVRGSPLRWYIAGAAILYLAGCAALWRLKPVLWARWSWASQAATSFLVLLALLTATAWLPGGLEHGVSLFGQTTPTVLSVFSALVVAICGLLLARLTFVPLAGKIVVGLLAAYGAAAFLLAVKFGTPFASLYHGGSVWTNLPFWLQGATVGGLLVVPLALILKVVTGMRRETKIAEAALMATAMFMSVLISVAAVRLPTHDALGPQPCDSNAALDAAAPGASGAPDLGGNLGGLFGSTPSGSNAHPAQPCVRNPNAITPDADSARQTTVGGSTASSTSTSDPNAWLADLQNSVHPPSLDVVMAAHRGTLAEQFAYVRDKIKLDVYSGAMRGALGTGIAHAGNPSDKALLLAALLKSAGKTVRFARATIESPDITRLIETARAVKLGPAGIDLSLFGGSAIDAIVGAAPEQYRVALRAQLARASEAAKATLARADSQAQDIKRLLSSANVELGDETKLSTDATIALRDHVWVQLQNGNDWQDLDPSLPSLLPGQRMPTARNIATSDELPSDQQVTLQARVVATRLTNGAAVDADLLNATNRVVDLLTIPLVVEVLPDSDVPVKDVGTTGRFRARLTAGNAATNSDSFEIGGSKEGALLAVTLKLTVKRPGFDATEYTRTIVDRRGPHGAITDLSGDTHASACALTARFNGLVVTGRVSTTEFEKRAVDE